VKSKKTVEQTGFQAAKRKSLFIEVSILSGQKYTDFARFWQGAS
jgi:hypothetical protein